MKGGLPCSICIFLKEILKMYTSEDNYRSIPYLASYVLRSLFSSCYRLVKQQLRDSVLINLRMRR